MAEMTMRRRFYGGYKYTTCPDCNHEFTTARPIELELPYCSACGKAILDAEQSYCGWCGEKFVEGSDE